MFEPRKNNIAGGCLDGEIRIWDECYSISGTDSLSLKNSPVWIKEKNATLKNKPDLTGSIPEEIYSLSNLEYLDLSYNKLDGSISNDIKNLKKLNYLDLSHNNLGGDINNLINFFSNIEFVNLKANRWIYHFPIWADTYCGYNIKVEDSLELNSWDKINDYFGLMHGTFKEWYSNDLLKTEVEYHYGSLKTFNHWDVNGNRLITKGNGVFKDYWNEDVLLMEGNVINGYMEKEWKFYYGDHETWGDPVGNSFKEAIKGENPIAAVVQYKKGKGFDIKPYHETWGDSYPAHGSFKSKLYFSTGELFSETFENGSYTRYDKGGFKTYERIVKGEENEINLYLVYEDGAEIAKVQIELSEKGEIINCYFKDNESCQYVIDTFYPFTIGYCECE